MSFDEFAVAVSKCSSSARYSRRRFWLAVVAGDEGASVTRGAFREAITAEVSKGLPPGASYSLRETVISETVDSAFGEGKSTLSNEEADKWLMGNQATEGFFSDLVQVPLSCLCPFGVSPRITRAIIFTVPGALHDIMMVSCSTPLRPSFFARRETRPSPRFGCPPSAGAAIS